MNWPALTSVAFAVGISAVACSVTASDEGAGPRAPDGASPDETGDGATPAVDGAVVAPDAKDGSVDGPGGGGSALGTVSQVAPGNGSKPCAPGATCQTMTVSCPGLPDLKAIVALRPPSGAPKGTIYVHGGGGGNDFYSTNVAEFADAGFRVAQVRWDGEWEQTPAQGIKAAACRPATVLKWVFDEIQKGDKTTGFCASGHSGGSSAISYALTEYGAESFLDYAALLSGPPFARLDYGCAPQTYSGPPTTLCNELPNAPLLLPPKIDPWEHTTSCTTASPPAADLARWAADSIVSPGADYDYPHTPVDFWDCATNPNGTAGGAYFYSREITSTHSVHCATDCSGEALGPTLTKGQLDAMVASCKPHP